eukprot:350380-Chlamydomonas_euryale.AAC.7
MQPGQAICRYFLAHERVGHVFCGVKGIPGEPTVVVEVEARRKQGRQPSSPCVASRPHLDLAVLVRKVGDRVSRAPRCSAAARLRPRHGRELVLLQQTHKAAQRAARCNAGLVLGLDSQKAQDEACLLLHLLMHHAASHMHTQMRASRERLSGAACT